MPTLMLDHPAWFHTVDGRAHRLISDNHQAIAFVTAECLPQNLFIHCEPIGSCSVPIDVGYFDPADLAGPLTLTAPLRALGAVSRLANPYLWDALGTAILGQFVTPTHLERLYDRLCRTHGRQTRTPHGDDRWLFPRPGDISDVLALAKLPTLQNAARAYHKHGGQWTRSLTEGTPAADLVEMIATALPKLDRATISRAVADHSNDFTVYPIDMTLRSSVCRLSARHSWPVRDDEFYTEWQTTTGEQQSEWTVLTLAAGTGCYMKASSPAAGATQSD
ncbi:hypothetical protein [Nocardia sp. CS682]|uniref:hypothetical protein n=1 Tax=Nocardia sp. CS682 TaxID=1047172 RepID=UPI0010751246|nr:hypothetical protein [Nocardia sp. CS682]QBS41330.1 hypothetical protein DMB37_15565 [Nocardia sp. CS682]